MTASQHALSTDAAGDARGVLAFPRCPTAARLADGHPVSAAERVDLERLRWMALRAQLAPRPDLERACFLLAGESGASFERFAICFFRGLDARSRRAMVFYRPGAKHLSDDEIWLLRLVSAWRRGEEKAASALVSWRVAEPGRRWLRFLSAGMVRTMDGR
jgi:hypothetical protein